MKRKDVMMWLDEAGGWIDEMVGSDIEKHHKKMLQAIDEAGDLIEKLSLLEEELAEFRHNG